jgi:signal transduction histidine kinase/ligand-binding sensor domain-containing protein
MFILQALLICASNFYSGAYAQSLKKFSSTSYGVREGLLSGHVLDVAEDGNGFLWISTGVGLQRFDGKTFQVIPSQPGLPQTTHLSFFKLKNGNIWLNDENGIYVYDASADKFKQVIGFSKKKLPAPLIPLLETSRGVWCRDALQKKFVCIDELTGRIVDTLNIPDNMQPAYSTYTRGYGNTLLYHAAGFLLVEIDFRIKKIMYAYKLKSPGQDFSTCVPVSKTDLILATAEGLKRVNMATGATIFFARYPKLAAKRIQLLSLTPIPHGLLVLSINNQLFAISAATGRALYQLVDQQNDFFADPGYISNCITDQYDHLWAISTAEGMKKITLENLGIKYYGFGKLPQNFNRCIYPDKKANIIITGSLFNGFSVFDTTQRLIKHFNLPNDAQTSCIIKIHPFKYLLFVIGRPGVYLLNTKTLKLTPLPKSPIKPTDLLYQTYAQSLSDSTAVLFCNQAWFIVNFSKNRARFTKGAIAEEFSAAIMDHKKRIWLGQTGKYIVLTGKDFLCQTAFYLPEKVKIQCFMEDNDHDMWVGTEKGMYKIKTENGAVTAVYQSKDGLANDCIYSIVTDNNGNTWCGTNKGISGIYPSGKIINIHSSDGLQGDEFNTNSYAKASDNELFFGGINGVSSFFPDSMQKIGVQPKILMTDIKVMEESLNSNPAFTTRKITLPYSKNIISFAFTALGRYSPDEYTYQYKMSGIDRDWVVSGNSGYARYSLPPGNYIFEYTAGDAPARNLQYKKIISLTITPPIWRTNWFIALIIVITTLLVIGSVNLYYRLINRKTLRQMEVQQTLQLERERISRDLHDNIGAYTTVLIASVENLAQEDSPLIFTERAQTIAENAKNIMASLHETIWILNNDAITITDFIDRFKLYANKTARNFSETKITFKEDLLNNVILGPSESLDLFRILQEILQNAFKHAKTKTITISVHSNHDFCISIKDDGIGFDASSDYPGNGLCNIKYRVKEAGYSLTIISTEVGTETTLQKNKPGII